MNVVGIGASAGGLEALERFFDNVPARTGMAFVVVQHLSPDFKSVMGELLARHTDLPIKLVEDGMPIEADHVYLIPPKKEMIVAGGRLLLSERERQLELTLPIDVFFRSLAQDCGTRAVAIVLSGGGSDGSRGIRNVRARGGLVVVQDASAQFDGMPRTAIDAGVAHFVLPPERMPEAIIEHAGRSTRGEDARGDREPPSRGKFDVIYRKLEEEFGIDFTHYKPNTVTRRIERRLQLARAEGFEGYVRELRENRDELDMLYRDLLIGVTRFFRNEEAFAVLGQRVFPDLIASRSADTPLRLWVAGCATGEEVYSLAIVLHEVLERHGDRPVKIFASDVHRGSLEIASRGIYSAEAVKHVSPERLARYFSRIGSSYQVIPELRQHIVFAPHNVIRDAPFTRIDFVSCRNLLIYLQPPAQQKALSLFHFALNRGGVLFLGPSETAGQLTSDFEPIQRYWRIFRKHSDVRIPVDARFTPTRLPELRSPVTAPRHSLPQLLRTYDLVLDEFMPPGLLVNQQGELVHVFAGGEAFLKPRAGRQGLDVLDVVDPPLKMILVGGIQRALREPSMIRFNGVRLEDKTYGISLRKIGVRGESGVHVLVTFETTEEAPLVHRTEIDAGGASREQITALEAELSSTRESLQAAIEELETSNEELQASNEELLTANEELQSTNEELQSVNEELYTVNAEYQRKIAELTELTNDINNLFASTDIGTVFLDTELKIRKFTPPIAETFNLLPQDVGRSIDTFAHAIDDPDLFGDLKKVLASGTPIEREISDRQGRAFFLRILPYRAKSEIAGVVLSLIDMGSMKAAEDALFHERYLLDSLLANVPDRIYFRNADGRFIRVNEAMAERFGVEPREVVDRTPFDLYPHETAVAIHDEDARVLRTGEAQHYRVEKRTYANRAEEWNVVTRLPLKDRTDAVVGVVAIARDVTKQRRAEERIQQDVVRRDQFLAMLSHELRNPLGAIVTATALLQDGAQAAAKGERLLTIIARQSQQMARLLDDLLEVSRVTQNKIELRCERVDLGTIARDAADAVRVAMSERDVSFDLHIPEGAVFVDGDPARLLQVQVNVLNNAAKYTPKGGHVWLRLEPEGGDAVLRVRDDGAGIAKEMLDSIFDLFVQSRRTLDRSDGGLGVGLTLVRALVAMHGGAVSCRSEGIGKGSEFEVRLPLARGEAATATSEVRDLRLPRGSASS